MNWFDFVTQLLGLAPEAVSAIQKVRAATTDPVDSEPSPEDAAAQRAGTAAGAAAYSAGKKAGK